MKILFIEGKDRFLSFDPDLDMNNYVFSGWRRHWSILNIKKYDAVISTLAHNSYVNAIIMRANKHSIPTVLIVDGIFEWNNSFNNPYLNKIGVDLYRPNIHKYIYVVADDITRAFIGRGSAKVCAILNKRVWGGKIMEIKTFSKVLITTANTPCFNNDEYLKLASLINMLVEYFKKNSIEFEVRIFDERLLDLIPLGAPYNNTSGSFGDLIPDFSHVITTPSSIALEAMSNGLAVCQLIYRDTPLPFQSGWLFGGIGVESFTASFLASAPERYKYQLDICKAHSGISINSQLESLFESGDEKETSSILTIMNFKIIVIDFFKLVAVEAFNKSFLVKKIKKYFK